MRAMESGFVAERRRRRRRGLACRLPRPRCCCGGYESSVPYRSTYLTRVSRAGNEETPFLRDVRMRILRLAAGRRGRDGARGRCREMAGAGAERDDRA